MNPIGIMQGRLSPPGPRPQSFPSATWRDEFEHARSCGFERLEWLVTADGLDQNPLCSDAGIADLRRLSDRTGLEVSSVCADCCLSRPLIGDEWRVNARLLTRVVEQSRQAGIAVVVLPVLETAAIRTDRDRDQLLEALREPLAAAATTGVRIAIESDQAGAALAALIDAAGSPQLGANYDVGNAAAAGHDCARDLRALGSRLFGVHIKDRKSGGSSRPLGEGDVDFDAALRGLARAGYAGPLILETPVGDDAARSARRNLSYLKGRIDAMAAAT